MDSVVDYALFVYINHVVRDFVGGFIVAKKKL